jgi:hypothetical protein
MATGQQPSQLGEAQWAFIKAIRSSIKNDPKLFFKENNWRMIEPSGGRFDSGLLNRGSSATTTVDDFYVKPIGWLLGPTFDNRKPFSLLHPLQEA